MVLDTMQKITTLLFSSLCLVFNFECYYRFMINKLVLISSCLCAYIPVYYFIVCVSVSSVINLCPSTSIYSRICIALNASLLLHFQWGDLSKNWINMFSIAGMAQRNVQCFSLLTLTLQEHSGSSSCAFLFIIWLG